MAQGQLGSVLRHLRQLLAPPAPCGTSDAELLQRFVSGHEEAAFGDLLRRHGPMVLGVCRRLLHDPHQADDAFQATFLVLVRRAGSLRAEGSLGPWLHGVARRVSLKARAAAARRRLKERQVEEMPQPLDPAQAWDELRPVLDAEVDRLPAKYRAPVVLCYLEGRTNEEAAQELGWPAGTVKCRLARAREMLRQRLDGRGLCLAALLVSDACATASSPTLSASLCEITTHAVSLTVAGGTPTGSAAALAEGVLRTMSFTKYKLAALVICVGCAITGAGLLASQALEVSPPPAAASAAPAEAPRLDGHGDPLPPGVLARLGTVRLRHRGAPSQVVISADGKFLISCGQGGIVSQWDAASGKEVRQFRSASPLVTAVCLSLDGTLLASCEHGTVRLWDVGTAKELRRCKSEGWIQAAAFTADGKMLIGLDRQERQPVVRHWSVATGEEALPPTPCPFPSQSHSYVLSADGGLVAFWGQGKEAQVWDTATGKLLHKLVGHKTDISKGALSLDGKTLVTAGYDKQEMEVRVWDTATGKERDKSFRLPMSFAFTVAPDGDRLVCVSRSTGEGNRTTLAVHEVLGGKELLRVPHPLQETTMAYVGSDQLLFSADGKTLVAYGGSSAITLLDPATGKVRAPHGGPRQPLRLFPSVEGKTLATLEINENGVRLWDAATLEERRAIKIGPEELKTVALSPDGRFLATGGVGPVTYRTRVNGAVVTTESDPLPDPVVRVWDVGTGKEVHRLKGARYSLEHLSFAPDGKTIFTMDGTFSFHALDVDTGAAQRRVEKKDRPGGIRSMSADGRTALTQLNEGGLCIWDTVTGKDVGNSDVFRVQTRGGALSPDGRTLVAVDSKRGLICTWDVASGRALRTLRTPASYVTPAFSPDGKWLALPLGDSDSVILYEAKTLREAGRFSGDQGRITGVAFGPGGKTLLVGGNNATVLAWDLAAAAPPAAATKPTTELAQLWTALADDNQAIAVNAIWDLAARPQESVAFLSERVRPAPVPEEAVLASLIAGLDEGGFDQRNKSSDELAALGDAAEGALKKALEGKSSLELKRRIEALLKKIDTGEKDRRREARAVDVLEIIQTPEAMKRLVELSKGRADARVTGAAREALGRLPD